MNELSGGIFLLTAATYAGVALLVTEKVNDILKLSQTWAKYVSALCTSFGLAHLTRFVGSDNMAALINIIGGGNAKPIETGGGSLLYWNAIALLSFLVAGGIYDWRKNKKT